MMTKSQWNAMILVVVALALAVGFLGGSLYEKRAAQSVEVSVGNDDALKRWLKQCGNARGKQRECIITGEIE